MKHASPKVHQKVADWAEIAKSTSLQGHSHKDEFRKSKRLTVPQEIFELAKRRKGPDLGSYHPKHQHKIRNFANVSTSRDGLTDECIY